MKTMKKILMVLMVLSMVVVFAGQTVAGIKFQVCKVVGCSIQEDGTVKILLERQDQLRTKYFDIPTGQENMMMSIALSAMSMDKDVQVKVDWSHSLSTEILELRVLP